MANRRGKYGNSDRLYFLGPQNHCQWWLQPWNYKMLASWKKSNDKPRQCIESKDITLPTKFHIIKAMVFLVLKYRCESWTIKMADCWRTDAFELWRWGRLFRVPWTVRRLNQSILKEINPEYSLEGLMWNWSSNTLAIWCKEVTHWKNPWCWERLKAGEGDDRGWDSWMASPNWWTWILANFGSWWWKGRPGMLQSNVSQRVRYDWVTELTEFSRMQINKIHFLTWTPYMSSIIYKIIFP